jgi:hypothetical protein
MTTAKAIATRDNALDLARAMVRKTLDERIVWFGVPLNWFEPGDTLCSWREQMKAAAVYDPMTMRQFVQFARAGWPLADDVLCELELHYEHSRAAKPLAFESYMSDRHLFGRPEQVKSMQPHSHFHRDIAIICIVAEVCIRFGLKPTGQSERRSNGSAIVAQALRDELVATIDEASVRKIWSRWGKIAFPGGLETLRPLLGEASAIACG